MKKRWVAVITLLSVAIGFLAGAYAGVRFWQSFDEAALETSLMADARMRLLVLSSLRNSHEDQAILLLENLLDGDVIGISSVMETSRRKTELVETLAKVASYRAQTNYRSPNGEVETAVRETLERAGQPNSAVKRDAQKPARPLP